MNGLQFAPTPHAIKATLRPCRITGTEGSARSETVFGGVLADDMGLGSTFPYARFAIPWLVLPYLGLPWLGLPWLASSCPSLPFPSLPFLAFPSSPSLRRQDWRRSATLKIDAR
jgi:hypothetical protein